jgi:hypothetical protein
MAGGKEGFSTILRHDPVIEVPLIRGRKNKNITVLKNFCYNSLEVILWI